MIRVNFAKQLLKKLSHDALLVSNHHNIFYLTGFKGLSEHEREAWLLVTQKDAYFFTDARYNGTIEGFITKVITPEKNIFAHLQEIAQREKLKKIGCEADDLTVSEFDRFSKHFTLAPTEKIILNLRAIKTADEIQCIQKACTLADRCLTDITKQIKPGITEREIAWKIELWLKERGSDLAFYPIVAVDENAALAHYDTKNDGSTKIKKGSLLLIDFGAVYKNYLSDMTRMVFVGAPSDELRNTYDVLQKAQQAGIDRLTKTDKASEIDAACRLSLANYELYPHSTGHGVGLEIHEEPKISGKSTNTLTAGNVITIEPGIYIPGRFGMRIEDTVLVRENNKIKILTQFSKKMLVM